MAQRTVRLVAESAPGLSPDRADAMVWAMAELTLGEKREPRVRGL